MTDALTQLGIFSAKLIIIFAFIVLLLVVFFALVVKSKEKTKGRLIIKNLNESLAEDTETIFAKTLSKANFKKYLKEKKAAYKAKQKEESPSESVYVINFNGDIKASAVEALREEITAILNVATANDEVVVCIESAGGMVHGYGLAAAQLLRLRAKHIRLIVTIDKIAASGGYLMACVANKILCAPFAIVGSIGVVVQLPNFHRVLKDKHIDFEQHTAGDYKRTLSLFGENTSAGREKLQQEIEEVHQLFKNLIAEHRQQIDIQQVATGEHWLGQQALPLKLVDEIKTSDDYLLERSKKANVYEICYELKKPFLARLAGSAAKLQEKLAFFRLFY